jgi:catechol 2,3-dioxygenase-like lactoylglutathione lyase family enzyme
MAHLTEIVVDARRPLALARFWAAVLDGYRLRPFVGDDPAAVALDGPGPTLLFQRGERPGATGRLHFDLAGGPREAEVARLEALGATLRDIHPRHTVMLDPEGNRFCVKDEGA